MSGASRLGALVPLLFAAGAGLAALPAQDAVAPAAAGLTVPRPELGRLEEAPRRKIETLQTSLEELLERGDLEAVELREGFGFLGQLFHAFELHAAAADCYASAARLAPADFRWPYLRGLALQARGDLPAAAEAFARALELAPGRPQPALRLGDARLETGDLEGARDAYDRALAADPDDAAALFGLGRAAAVGGDPGRAAELFERVLELQPEATAVHYPLAQAYRALGDGAAAERHLARRGDAPVRPYDPLAAILATIAKSTALEVVADLAADDETFSSDSFLGFTLAQFRGIDGASEQLALLAERLDRDGAPARQRARVRYALGGLLAERGDDEAAAARFTEALELEPELVDAAVKSGNALARLGRFEEARERFDQALERRPGDPELLTKRAAVRVNLEDLDGARVDLQQAMASGEPPAETRRRLAELEERAGDPEAALAAYDAALVAAAERPRELLLLHTARGHLLWRQRRFESAARSFLAGLQIDQGHVPALDALARLLAQLGYFDRAAEVYGKWVAAAPTEVAPRLGEATALILAGRHAAARQRLEEGLELLPESLDLKDVLARHLAACPDRTVRSGERAVELAEELYTEVPTPESLETLAMAYAEAGRFADAIASQESLLESAGPEAETTAVRRWQANLDLYRERRPCCAAP